MTNMTDNCKYCNQTKPISEFDQRRRCIKCASARRKARRHAQKLERERQARADAGILGVTTKDDVAKLIEQTIFPEIRRLRGAGQAEYAGGENAFGNFERVAADLGVTREQVLWVYAMKHRDGIAAWIGGHKSQREDVRGRIADLMVYLCLLWAMADAARDQEVS